MVRAERHHAIAHAHLVGVRLAGKCGGGEALADLHALHRVDRHQRGGDVGIQLAVDRCAEAGRHAFGHHLDDRAGRRSGLAYLGQVLSQAATVTGSGQKNGLSSTASQSQRARSMRCGPIWTRAPRMRTSRPAPCAPRRRRRPASRSRAPRSGRRHDSRGCRISAHRSGRHGRGGTARRSPSSRASVGRRCRSAWRSACRWSGRRTRRTGCAPRPAPAVAW